MATQITIRARVNEKVNEDGVGYPWSVTVTGASALDFDTVREIAQEAIYSYCGNYTSNRYAVLSRDAWQEAKKNDSADSFIVSVVSYS
jgi:hypothetical protein